MTPRNKLMLSLAAVPAAFVLLLVVSLTLASAASPLEPVGIGVAATTGSPGSAIGLQAPGTGEDDWTGSTFSPNEPSETRWMVASYNGVSGAASVRAGPESREEAYILYTPRADLDTTLFVQNLGSGPATVLVTFYDSSGALVHTAFAMIPYHGSLGLELDSLSGLPPEYEGSAVLESDRPIQAVVNVEPDATGILLSYGAVETIDVVVVLPLVFRDFYDLNSSFWVQNPGTDPANIMVTYYRYGIGPVYTTFDSIAPSASQAHHLVDETELGADFQGLVSIECSEPVAVAAETVNLMTQVGTAWRGIPLAHGDPTILAPLQQKLAGVSSSSIIANLGAEVASVEANWYTGDGSAVYTQEDSVPPGDAVPYVLPAISAIPDGFDGSMVASADQPLGGIVHWHDLTLSGDSYAESPAIGLGQVGDHAYLPRVAHSVSAQVFTEFSILNAASADTPVEVTITFYDQSGAVSAVVADEIPFHGVGRYATGEVAALGDEWQGSVIVSATQPVAVEVRQLVGEPSTCPVVTDPADSGLSTLRGCLEGANAGDTITFDPAIFPPGSPATIALTSGPLPIITQDNLTLDASTAGVILDGSALDTGHGLHITSTGTVVQGIQILHFPDDGIRMDSGASINLVGGDVESERNVLSGNGGSGVVITGSGTLYNTVTRNSIMATVVLASIWWMAATGSCPHQRSPPMTWRRGQRVASPAPTALSSSFPMSRMRVAGSRGAQLLTKAERGASARAVRFAGQS